MRLFNDLNIIQKIIVLILLNTIFFIILASIGYYYNQRVSKQDILILTTLLVFLAIFLSSIFSLIGAYLISVPLQNLLES